MSTTRTATLDTAATPALVQDGFTRTRAGNLTVDCVRFAKQGILFVEAFRRNALGQKEASVKFSVESKQAPALSAVQRAAERRLGLAA